MPSDAPAAPPAATAVPTPEPSPTAVPTATADQIATAAQPSVVHVVTDAGSGSGVKIADGILTSAHVVQDTATIDLYTADHRHAKATLTRIDPTADIALLKTDLSLPQIDVEPVGGQHVGDAVIALGYPTDTPDAGAASVVQGQLSSTGTGIQGRALLETTAALQPGYSGGPLLNARGHLIGLNTFVAPIEGQIKLNFFLGSDTAYAFLALPDDKVAPRPMALFTGDARAASLPYAYLGTGWVVESEDTSHLAQGVYWSKYHLDTPDVGRIVVQAGTIVTTSPATAAGALPSAVPPDQQFDQIGTPTFGDDGGVWLSKSGRTAVVAARVANVVVAAVETRGYSLSSDEINSVAHMAHYMCDRVVSQVK
jgi:S1-C subfamily serine protease